MGKKKEPVKKQGWKAKTASGHKRHQMHPMRTAAAGKVLGAK